MKDTKVKTKKRTKKQRKKGKEDIDSEVSTQVTIGMDQKTVKAAVELVARFGFSAADGNKAIDATSEMQRHVLMQQILEALVKEPLLQTTLEGIQAHLNKDFSAKAVQTIMKEPSDAHVLALSQLEQRQSELQELI